MQTLQQLQSGQLAGITRLKLSSALTEFPKEIFDLAETLEILDLSVNQLTHLPDNFGQLKKLRIVFLSENNFTEFPEVLCNCPELDIVGFKANAISLIAEDAIPVSLRWLILTNNRIEHLPKSIGECVKLQKVMLAGNKLKQLPVEMAACRNIELLRISANNIDEFPAWLFSLPRLSWLAYAGNPCSRNVQIKNDLNEISWNEFELYEQLGEGASGIITKAAWQNRFSNTRKYVAVKVFKGEVTSDGLPEDEMNACVTAGNHPHLVQLLGKIVDHPQQKQGLVFDLIPPTFKNLGGPPDFKTCTRDTFKEGTTFSLKQIIAISSGIASAAGHLHAKGLMHGDLYAHNTLIDENAYPLFGDFGAATPYDFNNKKSAKAIEKIEVRAFGCLLDDLLLNIASEDKATPAFETLIKLKQDCMIEDVSLRPGFSTVHNIITSIQK